MKKELPKVKIVVSPHIDFSGEMSCFLVVGEK